MVRTCRACLTPPPVDDRPFLRSRRPEVSRVRRDGCHHGSSTDQDLQYSEQASGTWAALKGLVHRPVLERTAVAAVDLVVQPGEVLGLLGPNGAGKTTTIKMLCGLLHPTSGELDVLGFRPSRRQFDFLRSISVVFGQKSMLWWTSRRTSRCSSTGGSTPWARRSSGAASTS
jgi:ABC-type glutathione transport system ATPase component